jgi:hypothetical protein
VVGRGFLSLLPQLRGRMALGVRLDAGIIRAGEDRVRD